MTSKPDRGGRAVSMWSAKGVHKLGWDGIKRIYSIKSAADGWMRKGSSEMQLATSVDSSVPSKQF